MIATATVVATVVTADNDTDVAVEAVAAEAVGEAEAGVKAVADEEVASVKEVVAAEAERGTKRRNVLLAGIVAQRSSQAR